MATTLFTNVKYLLTQLYTYAMILKSFCFRLFETKQTKQCN